MNKKHDDSILDSPEAIQKCLSCTKEECTNCIERERKYPQSKSKEYEPVDYTMKLNKRDKELIRLYPYVDNDIQLCRAMGNAIDSVYKRRLKLRLPPPGRLSETARKALVQPWLDKYGL